MRKEFEKGSIEMAMFREYYRIIQDYWILENTDQYWQGLIDDMNDFYRKFQDKVPLARLIGKEFLHMMYRRQEDGEFV